MLEGAGPGPGGRKQGRPRGRVHAGLRRDLKQGGVSRGRGPEGVAMSGGRVGASLAAAPSVCPSGSRLDPSALLRASYAHRKHAWDAEPNPKRSP